MNRQQHSEMRDGLGSYVLGSGEKRYRVVMKVQGKTVSKGGFATKGAARAWRESKKADLQRGEYLDSAKGRIPFGVFADDWLATADVRPSTRAVYRHLLDHQLAHWATMPLANITPTAVRQWVAVLRKTPGTRTKRPPSRASVVKAYALLKNVCGIAVDEGYLRTNPCVVKMKQETPPDLYCPTPAEVMLLADAVPGRYRALVLLAGYGGLRWGEAIALQRNHIDIANGCVKVMQAVVETVEHEIYLQHELKTAAGERDVYLHSTVVQALAQHLMHYCGAESDALLFRGSGDQPYLRRGNWTSRVWKPALKQTGLPKTRFHDLRHAAATLAAQAGATTAELMAHIGHTTPRAAMRYQHAADDRMKAMGTMLDRFIPSAAVATGTDNVVPLHR